MYKDSQNQINSLRSKISTIESSFLDKASKDALNSLASTIDDLKSNTNSICNTVSKLKSKRWHLEWNTPEQNIQILFLFFLG